MNPATLLPAPDAIPAPWGWFQALLLVTFWVHILFMNAMFGSAFIAFVSRSKSSYPCRDAVAQILPFLIAFTVNFGVAPLLFAQVLYGHLFYTSSVLMAVFWLSVIGLLIVAYLLAYLRKYRYEKLGVLRWPILLVILAIFAVIAFIFTNNIGLMQNVPAWKRYFIEPAGRILNLQDSMQWPRYLHFLVSSVAVGGLTIATIFYWRQKHGNWAGADWIRKGCRWFSFATMVNICVGLWFLFTLPKTMLDMNQLHGQLLAGAVCVAVVLALVAIRYGMAGKVLPAWGWTLATVAVMVFARDVLRRALIAPWFTPSQLQVHAETSALIAFLVFLVLGLALISWLVPFTLKHCTPASKGGRP